MATWTETTLLSPAHPIPPTALSSDYRLGQPMSVGEGIKIPDVVETRLILNQLEVKMKWGL